MFASTRTLAALKGVRVNLIPEEVTSLHEDAEGRVHVGWDSGETTADEWLYRSKFETALLSYAAPCPIPTAERMSALFRAGRLRLITCVGEVALDPASEGYRLAHRFGVESVRYVINVTGRARGLPSRSLFTPTSTPTSAP